MPAYLSRQAHDERSAAQVHIWIVKILRRDRDLYRKSIGRVLATPKRLRIRAANCFSADYHQQYLAKNPNGYCGIGGCGVSYAPSAS